MRGFFVCGDKNRVSLSQNPAFLPQ